MNKLMVLVVLSFALSCGSLAFAEAQNDQLQGAKQETQNPTAAPAAQKESKGTTQVDKIAIGTAIDNKELSGEAKEFDASVGRVYCWTKVSSANAPAEIKHVWYANDKKEAEVSLPIKYSAMRTWSSKAVWPGQWKVEVTDDSGSVLSSTEFTVKAGAEGAAPTDKTSNQNKASAEKEEQPEKQ